MNWNEKQVLRIAILDLYEGVPNQGMRGLRAIINQFGQTNNLAIELDEFDVRLKNSVPDMSYDIYISSGGPGSPLESEGSEWEKVYFNWLAAVERFNDNPANIQKKQDCSAYRSVTALGSPAASSA